MAAMESSTKNATDLVGKLTLSYNRSATGPSLLARHLCVLQGGDVLGLKF